MPEQLKETQKTLVLSWPSPQDYNEAMQNPHASFADHALAAGDIDLDIIGLPKPTSGMFATVYRVRTKSNEWAVRCFLQSKPDQIYRYSTIRETLYKAQLKSTLHFDLQENGIRVGGQVFPILKMEWCNGEPLNQWLERNLRNKTALEDFLEKWRTLLSELQVHGIAHGDLQHGNVLIQNESIKLVDYDGVYVPDFHGFKSNELGHRNYQHPGRTEHHFGPYLDNFSAWLIYLSIVICGCDPHIFFDFEGGDECILFRRQDLEAPNQSELFYVLEHHHNPQIKECSRLLRYLLSITPESIPNLESAILVPEDFPEFQGSLSNMPDWISDDDNRVKQSDKNLFVRRRRRRAVPYKRPQQLAEEVPAGTWIYENDGLVFTPHDHVHAKAPIHSPGHLHSPLLDNWGKPEEQDNLLTWVQGPALAESNSPDQLYGVKVAVILVAMVCALFGLIPSKHANTDPVPAPSADQYVQIWENGEYYRLVEARKFMEQAEYGNAIQSLRSGINDLTNSQDSRATLSLAYMHQYLGEIYDNQERSALAQDQFRRSMQKWQEHSGANSADYAGALVQLAQSYQSAGQLAQSESSFKKAIAILEANDYGPRDEFMKGVYEEYAAVLTLLNKKDEAAKIYSTLAKSETAAKTTVAKEMKTEKNTNRSREKHNRKPIK